MALGRDGGPGMTEQRALCASCGGPICTRRRVRGVPREWETVWTHIRIADAEKCAKPEPRREGAAMNADGRPMAGCHACDEPLVLTFEFPKKEFICVECGALYEYFGPKYLEWTPERQARHDELAERYKVERAARPKAAS